MVSQNPGLHRTRSWRPHLVQFQLILLILLKRRVVLVGAEVFLVLANTW